MKLLLKFFRHFDFSPIMNIVSHCTSLNSFASNLVHVSSEIFGRNGSVGEKSLLFYPMAKGRYCPTG